MCVRSVSRFTLLVATMVLSLVAAAESPDTTAARLLGDTAGSLAIATGGSGAWAAQALPDPASSRRSVLRLASTASGKVDELQIPGIVRSLLFEPGGFTLYAIVGKGGKKSPPVVYLMEIDTGSLRAKRLINLPATSLDLALWDRGNSLLVACHDELRSYLLPDFRSGPLYRVLGANLAVEVVAGTNRILVGKEDRAVLIDLSDSHGEHEMPVRESFPLGAPVVAVRIDPEEKTATLVTQDGGETTLELPGEPAEPAPVTVEEDDEPVAAAVDETPPGEPEVEETPAPEPVAEEPEPEEPVPAPEDGAGVPEAAGAGAAAGVAAAADDTPPEEPEAEEAAPTEPVAKETEPEEPVPAPGDDEGGTVRGKLTGAERGRVDWVVLLGPNNLLREATRVRPGTDGRWAAKGLVPGSYRVILSSGGQRQVISSPPFQTARVDPDRAVDVPPFEVIRVE